MARRSFFELTGMPFAVAIERARVLDARDGTRHEFVLLANFRADNGTARTVVEAAEIMGTGDLVVAALAFGETMTALRSQPAQIAVTDDGGVIVTCDEPLSSYDAVSLAIELLGTAMGNAASNTEATACYERVRAWMVGSDA